MPQILEFPRGAIIFDPEIIKIVAQAFDDAWDKIEKSGSGFARPATPMPHAKKSPSI